MSSISAGTSAGAALVSAGDTTGDLILQVNGTTPSVSLKANGAIGLGSGSSYGTAGQALLSGGSGAAPSWGSAGALSLVSTQTASSSSFLEFTGLSGSNQYLLICALTMSTGGTNLVITLGTGATPTYLSSNYYGSNTATSNSSGNGAGYASINSTSQTQWTPTAGQALGGTYSFVAQFTIVNFTSGTPAYTGSVGGASGTYGGYSYTANCGGYQTNTSSSTPITAIRVAPSSGTFSSGTASLFRISV